MFVTKVWRFFYLINTLTSYCEGVKGKLWLPVLMEGLQGMYASFPLVSAVCQWMRGGCANGSLLFRSRVQALLLLVFVVGDGGFLFVWLLFFFLWAHDTSPILTCPFCSLNTEVGQNFLFFFLNMHRFSPMWLWGFSKYLLVTCGHTENEFASSSVALDLWKMSQASSKEHFCHGLHISQSTRNTRRRRDPGHLPVSGRDFIVIK